MRRQRRTAAGLAALLSSLLAAASGCETTVRETSRPRLPPPEVRFVDLAVIAAPVFHLVIPPASPDAASRLVAVHVQFGSHHANPVVVRPEWIRLLLPDGSLHYAFDAPRAAELLRRTQLARADRQYLEDSPHAPPGGIDAPLRARLKQVVLDELLAETRLQPGERAAGYLIIDTGRAYENLAGLPLEVVTTDEAPPPQGVESVPILARLSQPREPPDQ